MGSARNIKRDIPPDPRYLTFMNNLSNGTFANSVPTSSNIIGQFVKTKQGIFNGAFGSIEEGLSIDAGILDITINTNGSTVIKRVLHINPETGVTDTLIGLETEGLELPYQELILIGVSGDTITITHNSGSVTGTEKKILCPGNTDYILSGDEIIYMIYDTSVTSWIITGSQATSGADNLGNHTATQDLVMGNNQITGFAGLDQTSANSTGAINLINDASIRWKDSAGTGEGVFKFDSSDNFLFDNDIDIQGKNLILDADGDSHIESFNDDTVNIVTSSSIRLTVSNTSTIATGNLTTLGNFQVDGNTILGDTSSDTIAMNGTLATDIEMGGNDLDFATGGTIDFHDIKSTGFATGGAEALPSQPTAYFKVRYQGADRYIPYYTST